MHKGIVTNRTIARDMMNMLRPDSILNKNRVERQVKATQMAKEWRKNNPERAKEIGLMGSEHSKTPKRKKISSAMGKKYGPENAVKYIPIETKKRNGRKAKQNLIGEIVCEKCGRKTNKGNYARMHGNNCNEEKIISIIELLPNKFTKKDVKLILKETEDDYLFTLIFPKTLIYLKIIGKEPGGNQNGISIYSKNTKEINKVKKYLNK